MASYCALRQAPRLGCCVLGAVVLTACSLGPAFHRPANPSPAAWVTPLTQGSVWPKAGWWQGFHSKALDQYIAEAESHNDDIAVAIAQMREANDEARIAGAPLLPSLRLVGTANRQQSYNPFAGVGSPPRTLYEPELSASYVLDFWGRNRAARRSALATAKASAYNRETVALTVVSSVALTYFQVLELHDELQVAHSNVSNAQTILKGLQLEARVGTATALDVAQQAATVAALNAAIPPLQQRLRQQEDALATLVGRTPEAIEVAPGSLAAITEPPVRPGLPAALLARRPDVAQAEAQLRAANANIAEARAAIFPSVTLTSTGGFASSVFSTVVEPTHRIWALSASVVQDIFEGGAISGAYDYEKARYNELLADYHKTVLNAFSNVENALVSLQQTSEQQKREQTAVDTALRAFNFAQMQMRAGITNVLTVLNTETALFSAESTLVQVRYAHLAALVNLYEALGGGWTPSTPAAFEPGVHS